MDEKYNIGDQVEIPGYGHSGKFVVVKCDDPALLTLIELSSHPGKGKPFRIGRLKVRLVGRLIEVSTD